MNKVSLFIAAGAHRDAQRYGKFIPCAYAVLRITESASQIFWGIGNYKDTNAVFAEGLHAALQGTLPDDLDGPKEEFPEVTIVAKNTGFLNGIKAVIDREEAEKKGGDQQAAWKNVAALVSLLGIGLPQKPVGPLQQSWLTQAQHTQERYAEIALREVLKTHDGLFNQGEFAFEVVA